MPRPSVFFIVMTAVAIFWIWQFIILMTTEDDFFPGRFDKLIWGSAFILLVPIAPLAFFLCRRQLIARARPVVEQKGERLQNLGNMTTENARAALARRKA